MAIAAAVVGFVTITNARVDMPLVSPLRLAADMLLTAIPAVVLLVISYRPLFRPGLSVRQQWIAAALAAVAAFIVVVLPPPHLAHPASLAGLGDTFATRALTCLAFGVAWAVVVAVPLAIMRRAGGLGPNLSLAAALVGITALTVHCPIVHHQHIFVGHWLVVPVLWIPAVLPGLLQKTGMLCNSR